MPSQRTSMEHGHFRKKTISHAGVYSTSVRFSLESRTSILSPSRPPANRILDPPDLTCQPQPPSPCLLPPVAFRPPFTHVHRKRQPDPDKHEDLRRRCLLPDKAKNERQRVAFEFRFGRCTSVSAPPVRRDLQSHCRQVERQRRAEGYSVERPPGRPKSSHSNPRARTIMSRFRYSRLRPPHRRDITQENLYPVGAYSRTARLPLVSASAAFRSSFRTRRK
ncbi:hypothetical protein OF83DRAFT_1107722 [Amylostereum chailletii]|nr:hypothetical protein OF83DRAFT_1107722 [Amylostereum chailletii]